LRWCKDSGDRFCRFLATCTRKAGAELATQVFQAVCCTGQLELAIAIQRHAHHVVAERGERVLRALQKP
jgi:hypothetical protein